MCGTPTGSMPSRVSTLFKFPLVISNEVSLVDLAFVSVNGQDGATNRLVILDITDRTAPHELMEIPIPAENGSAVYSVEPRDDGLLSYVLGSTPDEVRIAWDFRHETWEDVDGVVRVGDPEAEPFRYLRLREPPYTDEELAAFAETVRDPAYVYVRHEDEPTAPATVQRLRAVLDS